MEIIDNSYLHDNHIDRKPHAPLNSHIFYMLKFSEDLITNRKSVTKHVIY